MPPSLPKGTRFEVPKTGYKKYTAIVPTPDGKSKRVHFGDRRYQHFKDLTPLKAWSKLDHGDKKRRDSYRKRHGGMKCADGAQCIGKKYTPAWFSYYFLW